LRCAEKKNTRGGFILQDLLAALVAVAVLGLVTSNAVGSSRSNSKALACLGSLRQLSIAWSLYSQDNADAFAFNLHGGDSVRGAAADRLGFAPWASGWITWASDTDTTNYALIRNARFARIAPYIKSDRNVHKCPSDVFLSSFQKRMGWKERARTFSLNAAIGQYNKSNLGPWDSSSYVRIEKTGDASRTVTSPSRIFTFLEEHPDSINDPNFVLPIASQWVDFPGSLHEGAGTFAFLDGHGEMHEWRASARSRPVLIYAGFPNAGPSDPDLAWLRAHSPLRP
jgi:hypothetical protein